MPPSGAPRGVYHGVSAEHRAQIRSAMRAAARQVQSLGTRCTELERTVERIRDRSTLPNPDEVRQQIGDKWQRMWDALKIAERSLTDLFELFV